MPFLGVVLQIGARVRVRLTRKLAESLDGIDLSHLRVGAVVEVTRHEAELLIAEGWATPEVSRRPGKLNTKWTMPPVQKHTADRHPRRVRTAERLRAIHEQLQRRSFRVHESRRAEDRIRDEWHDERATILNTHHAP